MIGVVGGLYDGSSYDKMRGGNSIGFASRSKLLTRFTCTIDSPLIRMTCILKISGSTVVRCSCYSWVSSCSFSVLPEEHLYIQGDSLRGEPELIIVNYIVIFHWKRNLAKLCPLQHWSGAVLLGSCDFLYQLNCCNPWHATFKRGVLCRSRSLIGWKLI